MAVNTDPSSDNTVRSRLYISGHRCIVPDTRTKGGLSVSLTARGEGKSKQSSNPFETFSQLYCSRDFILAFRLKLPGSFELIFAVMLGMEFIN